MTQVDKRRQIMQIAEGLFATRRFHEITIDEVSKAAKVGKGTIYLYFKDKDDLFFQMALSGFDDLCAVLEQKVPEDAHFEEQLNVACTQIAEFYKRRRQAHQLTQGEDSRMLWGKEHVREEWLARQRKMVGTVAGVLRIGVAEGKIRQDITPEVLAHMLLAMLRTLAWVLADDAEARRKQISTLIDLFCRGAGSVGCPGSQGGNGG
jgi:AcrR family transcriptional regulator